jgi:hypothetical protein
MALRFWNFELRNTPPLKPFGDQKKKLEKKNVINTTPKKRHEHSLLRWLADAKKKKSGLSRRKLPRLFWIAPSWALPTHYPTKHHFISGPARPLSPHVFFGGVVSDPGRGSLSLGAL